MIISSRTPEGQNNGCGVCGQQVVIEPSTFPTPDAPCPHCGHLLWFSKEDIASPRQSQLPVKLAKAEPVLALTEITDPEERDQAQYLFESFSVVD
jgi:hypothetical protein